MLQKLLNGPRMIFDMAGKSLNRKGARAWQVHKQCKVGKATAELREVEPKTMKHAGAKNLRDVSDMHCRSNIKTDLRNEEERMELVWRTEGQVRVHARDWSLFQRT